MHSGLSQRNSNYLELGLKVVVFVDILENRPKNVGEGDMSPTPTITSNW